MKKFLFTFFIFCAFSTHAAEESTVQKLTPLEKQERMEGAKKLDNVLNEARILLEGMAIEVESQCMKAFGNKSFCECISRQIPSGINFIQYVMIISKTKDELKYDQLSLDDQKMINSTRIARDKCVK